MRIISFIYHHQVIRKILEYLKLYCPAGQISNLSSAVKNEKRQRAPPLKKTVIRDVESLSFDDDWPGYEEPFFEMRKIREWTCLAKMGDF